MSRYIRSLKGTLACMALGAMLAGCSADDIDTPRDTTPTMADDTQLVINLAVPTDMATAPGSRADVPDSGDPSMTPTAAEATVRNLRLVLYNPNNGKFYNRSLLAPDEMPVSPDRTAMYEITDIDEGSYYVYLFANLADVIEPIENKGDLEKAMMNYGNDGRSLTAGNLPMVYEGTAAIGVKGKNDALAAPMVNATLGFACAKVRMNLVFDKNDPDVAAMFGESGLKITALTLKQLSKESRVLYTPLTFGTVNTALPLSAGFFYTGYTENQANADVNDAWVLTPTGSGSKSLAAPASTWVWQAEFYVPERYVTRDAKPTQLYIEAASTTAAGVQSNITMNYTIDLGRIGNFTGTGADAALDADKNVDVVRGKLYEIIGKFKSYNNGEITTDVVARPWETTTIDVDMVATYLKLAKTTASVTSLESDQIDYDTDARGNIGFEVETPQISGKAPVIMEAVDGELKFSVNAAINLTTLSAADEKLLKGTATCYVTAGNIRKQVMIDYDITPFFIIKPLDQKIQYQGSDPEDNVDLGRKPYTYRTNLGGIIITQQNSINSVIVGPSKTTGYSTVNNKKITFTASQALSSSTGTIYVEATDNPITTTVHYLTAYPVSAQSNKYADLAQQLTVTVLPPLPNYRIYFRAINDYMDMEVKDGYSIAKEFLNGSYSNYRTENLDGGKWRWADWWTPSVTGDSPNNWHHRVYIYTQMGETYDAGGDPLAWDFTPGYASGGREMTSDNNNPGWYYFDQSRTQSVYAHGETKIPEPGKTLIIFYNNEETGLGYALHRGAHHYDPGIQLFDYEDREGYYIYDPTMLPYYRIYDEMPQVIDAEYIVYSKTQITGWQHSYGVAENQTQFHNPKQFTIKYDFKSSDGFRSTPTINGTTWHRTVIKLKALAEDKSKVITLNGLSRTTSQPQYAYYGYSPGKGFDNPYIYVFRGSGGSGNEVAAWPGEKMTYYLTRSDGIKLYRYEIPSGYQNGTVVFNPGSDNGKFPDLELGGQSRLTYSDNSYYWEPYGDQPDNAVVLNDGNDFPGNGPVFEVTFDGNNWYSGKPRN